MKMKKTYFLSDAHLGSRVVADGRAHEQRLVNFLDSIKCDAKAIYLLGDMFDFWFEYKTVVPKGFVRFLGKLAEFVDSGIAVHFFIGNHDMWTFGYLEQEIGVTVHRKPEVVEINGKTFFLTHGDGLNKQSCDFRFLRSIFHNRILQKFFMWVPPRLGLNFGYTWAKNNRLKKNGKDFSYKGEDKEYLVLFAKQYAEKQPIDYFIFGHRHIELDLQLRNKSRVLILGDWLESFSYAVFDGEDICLNCDLE